MDRRTFLLATPAALVARRSEAHHGWTSFDQSKPIYLEGKALSVRWQNPHAELELDIADGLALPADLAARAVPAQRDRVDGTAILAAAQLPPRAGTWKVELAPLTRMNAWQVPQVEQGATVAVVGFARPGAPESLLRAEFLLAGERVFPLRSGPA